MATAGPAQNQTVEEILASIRQAISDDGVKRSEGRPATEAFLPHARPEVPTVRRLFPAEDEAADDSDAKPDGNGGKTQDVIDLAIEKALDGVRAELEGGDAGTGEPTANAADAAKPQPGVEAPRPAGERPAAPQPIHASSRGPEERPQRPLLSSQAGAAVSASFDDLAKSMMSNAHRLEALVEGMLRPMLRGWLDDNLPLLVERLVREEIERVSRGRR